MTRALACVLLGACFGSGPVPPLPQGATVVFEAPLPADQDCSNSVYIGDVAIGAGSGFATLLPYVPSNNNGCMNGGGMAPMIVVNVMGFDKAGTDPAGIPVGMAGQSNGSSRPRLAVSGDAAVFAFTDQASDMSTITIMSTASDGVSSGLSANSPFEPVALVAGTGAGDVFLAGTQEMGGGGVAELDAPQFPCCGPIYGGQGLSPTGQLASRTLDNSTMFPVPVTLPELFDIPLKQSLVATDTSLIVIGATGSSDPIAVIESFPKAGGSATMLGTIPRMSGNVGPAGLAADPAHVAWSATFDPNAFDTGQRGCFIWATDGTTVTMLLSTLAFGCMDLAVDATSVYFTIFTVDANNGTEEMSGIGIGRVSLTDSSVETIALGFTGIAAGPRRIYLDGDDLYAVDPLVIGKLPKTALDNAHDFQP